MSQSCNLYLNPKWQPDEIKDIIERLTGSETTWRSTGMAGYDVLVGKDAMQISCFWNHQTPIGNLILLSRGVHGVELFKKIADVLGGLLEENDCNGNMDMINGELTENNALPYFLRYAVIKDGASPDSIPDLIQSIEKWGKEVSPHKITLS